MHIRAALVALFWAGHAVAFTTVLGISPATSTVSGLAGAPAAAPVEEAVAAIPKTFRALVASKAGSSFREVATVAELETPTPGPDEVLVRVRYAGINGGCETFRARAEHLFESNKDLENFRLGAEGVGTVAAVGSEVANFREGDAVCFVGSAFAEYSVANAMTVWKVPEATPDRVGLRISALTSCAMLEETGQLKEGETVLITAAAGGAGHFAVQFAKLAGCTVIGTCGSESKARLLESLGCDHVIRYKTQNVREELKKIAPDGLDAVLEGVGGSMMETALECLGPEGRLLQIGYISEYPHTGTKDDESSARADVGFDVAEIFWKKQTIRRGKQTIYGNAWPSDFSRMAVSQKRVLDFYASGRLKSIVDETRTFVGLDAVPDAIDHMLSGKTMGKVVVEIP